MKRKYLIRGSWKNNNFAIIKEADIFSLAGVLLEGFSVVTKVPKQPLIG